MRPRHKAAEYPYSIEPRNHFRLLASMRPRHKAAEYGSEPGTWSWRSSRASMRPRHKAAEYQQRHAEHLREPEDRFNEAAA